ncbi:MAG: DNA-directed RNA polymerase [Candidatus Thermoplasmatota archaeon]|nr:DNA-directed RNA polymerase [Candidatus Thermoplasmatota archaeon]MCL5785086.1 DNA-directed RNA polymerase [Candidatus Thermoplasmatota archaeon]
MARFGRFEVIGMYVSIEGETIIRVPPSGLGGDYSNAVLGVAKETLEGRLVDTSDNPYNQKKCYIVSVTKTRMVGDGTIVHGDGGVYQTVKYEALAFEPEMHEIVDGIVVSVKDFGAFVKFGPMEGLLHISQMMDDRIDIDLANQRFVGKDTKRDLKIGDKVRTKIVLLSLPSSTLDDAKIGLNTKQPWLGKPDWIRLQKQAAGA